MKLGPDENKQKAWGARSNILIKRNTLMAHNMKISVKKTEAGYRPPWQFIGSHLFSKINFANSR